MSPRNFTIACHNWTGAHSFTLRWDTPVSNSLHADPIPSGIWSHEVPYRRLTLTTVEPHMWSIIEPADVNDGDDAGSDLEAFDIP